MAKQQSIETRNVSEGNVAIPSLTLRVSMHGRTALFASSLLVFVFANTFAQKPKPSVDPFGDVVPDATADLDRATEKAIVARLHEAANDAAAASEAFDEIVGEPTELELRSFRNLDRELGKSPDAKHRELVQKVVRSMALSGEPTTLQYLHKVFDSTPARRALIADSIARFAIAKQRRPHEWPLLARSLTVVDGEDAQRVLQALRLFRERGTSPTLLRNVILLGLRLDEEGAHEASKLLAYWTGANVAKSATTPQEEMIAWQSWYHSKFPDLPEATLPREQQTAVHKYAELVEMLRSKDDEADTPESIARGAIVFEKTLCFKCHQFGERGERVGPNLTKVIERLTSAEIAESLLFPSQQISDQYATKRIVLKSGREISGIVGEHGDSLIVLPATAEKVIVPKADIEEILESPLSAMPSGLLDKLNVRDIRDMFSFLSKIPGE